MSAILARFYRRKSSLYILVIFTGLLLIAYPRQGPFSFNNALQTARPTVLQYDSNGLANGWEVGQRTHPIQELIDLGKQRWKNLLERQSKTLEEAVKNYRARYGRNPPKGFDAWYRWAKQNDVKILDDYDQTVEDTKYFFAWSPKDFRGLVESRATEGHSFVIHLDKEGESFIDGSSPENFRAHNLLSLIEPLVPHLPASIEFVMTAHDMGTYIPGEDQRELLAEKISAGEYVTQKELERYEWNHRHLEAGVAGLASVCSEFSPAWRQALAESAAQKPAESVVPPELTPSDAEHPNLIYNHRATFDFCVHPELLKFHGQLGGDSRPAVFRPMFQSSKLNGNGEIVTTPLDYYLNASDPRQRKGFISWDEKTTAKLHWRGSTTGDWYKHRENYNWRNSHRMRLHKLTHAEKGTRDIYVKSRRTGGWEMQTWEAGKVNKAYMDVGLVAGAIQCDQKDGTCAEIEAEIDWSPRVDPTEAAKFKYIFDVDGNGWSARFHRLLLSGSVVFKSTVVPEHFTDWLIPWYHYVPIQPTYSELYLALSFFIGVPGSPSTGNDDLAREIAENGRNFAMEHWRWEDMQSYMFRVLLEYTRLLQDDREAWEYTG